MQQLLFGHGSGNHAVTDEEMWRALRELRAAYEMRSFRMWLVGSRIDPGKQASDIDVVLSPKSGYSVDSAKIELALLHCRHHGLYGRTSSCVIDACFRTDGPTLSITPLQPETRVRTIKLLSPKLLRLMATGRLREYRIMGRFSVEFVRRASDTSYYRKLPLALFGGRLLPYLRPANEINGGDPNLIEPLPL
jgi:hypothetical protein